MTGEETLAGETAARDRMRAEAREQSRRGRGRYLTPEWLDHTFVLPDHETPPVRAAHSEAVALPRPRAERAPETPAFQRPATPEVDFAVLMRRADRARRARLATVAALALAVLAVVVFQVTAQPVAAVVAVVAALVALAAVCVRLVLDRAPVPYRSA
ncbi:MAG: hypothetical protein JOZ82_11625 [Marmoricola sp.]|nr:hypothetical protein [Marmoricola sp.]